MVACFLEWPEDGGDDPHGKGARRPKVNDVEFTARSQYAPHFAEGDLPSRPFEMVQDQAGKDPVERPVRIGEAGRQALIPGDGPTPLDGLFSRSRQNFRIRI